MFRIKKLDIFIAKQFGQLFAGTFFICTFVLMMQFLWRYVDDLIGKGLPMDTMAKFFWYMGLMLLPQAFPLAILLSSLITYGNLGESSELTAIKAAGISLMQSMRSIIVITLIVTGVSYYFQDVVAPYANRNFAQLLLSMRQKSPELEIPEGTFYDGLPNLNIYVQRKDMNTGKLYDIMIYRQTGSYEDQAIILADSGMMQTTAEKKHLLLTLWNGEWFENMRSQELGNTATVPYRRETFSHKQIVMDFDSEFSLADASIFAGNAKTKSAAKIINDLDSINEDIDSIGLAYYQEARQYTLRMPDLSANDSLKKAELDKKAQTQQFDTLFAQMTPEQQRRATKEAARLAQGTLSDVTVKSSYSEYLNRQVREHQLEGVAKLTLSLSCLIFFFIGAPLGAIIRKGGLGVPVIISVLVYIIYYIFEHSGTQMAKGDNWSVWIGSTVSTLVLTPMAVFFTYKANRDSTVFNIDAYKLAAVKMLGLRVKRYIPRKEVIIDDPDYDTDAQRLADINADIAAYHRDHDLKRWPNPVKVFFQPGDDRSVRDINERLEAVIEDLSNTRNKVILHELNNYPILATHAHTRPFRQRWQNIVCGVVIPVGLFFYLRMLRFRRRLYFDLKNVEKTSEQIITHITTDIKQQKKI